MDSTNVVIKPCVVILEQFTPKAELALSAELKNAIHERNILTAKSKKKIFSALDEINIDENVENKKTDLKNLYLQEILDTEVTYLKQLEILMNFFVKPLRSRGILTDDDLHIIFGNIKTIYEVNGALLSELKHDLTNVAEAFSKLAPFFKLYSVYACDYNKSIKRLEELILNKPAFAKFVDNQETRPEVQTKLSALLIAPIQRIPRYRLLLEKVLENTCETESDYTTLKGTLKNLRQAANHINTLLAEKENAQRLLELQRSLYKSSPAIIKPGRTLVKEGFLKKFSNSADSDERKYCVLLSDILILCEIRKPNIHATNSLKCELILPLNKCKLNYYKSTKVINITCETETLFMYHDSSDECEKWINCLNDTINKYNFDRQTLRKESSLRRPANKNTFHCYSELGVSPYKQRNKRKLPIVNDDFQSIYKNTEDSDSDFEQSCFSVRPLKRKSFRENGEIQSKRQKLEVKDSLFPLRFHSHRNAKNENKQIEETDSTELSVVVNKNINNDKPQGNHWKIVNAFNNISRGVKRIFGYE